MAGIVPRTTVASLLEINPRAAQILFRYGIRTFFAPEVSNQTLEQLSMMYNFNLSALIEDLNHLITLGSGFLRSL